LMSQMRMVCDSTYILDQKTRFDTKIDELQAILDEFLDESDEKAVIFSQWERMTRLVAAELDKKGIRYEYLHGGVPSAKRKDLMDNFMTNPDCRVFISTDAGSTGLNLQAASLVVNLDLPWNPAVLEQRIARIHRMGQKNNIQVINFVSVGTIEEQMLTKLNFKSSMFEGILDGGADSIFLEESKFDKLMQSVQEFAATGAEADTTPTFAVSSDELEKKVPEKDRSSNEAFSLSETMIPDIEQEEERKESVFSDVGGDGSGKLPDKGKATEARENASPEQLISQSVNLLGAFLRTLSTPEATAELVDTLIETDHETGKTSLKIPVPGRDSVIAGLAAIGKLLYGLSRD